MDKNESKNVDEYISGFPQDVQDRMRKLRKTILEIAPDAVEEIRYKMASFKLAESTYVYFAGFKNHISFYPFPTGVKEFKEAEDKFNTSGRGTIQFKHDEELPYELVREMTKYWKTKGDTGSKLYNSGK